jgi:hypothetical protein
MTAAVEVFADVRCPFTHVGLRRLVGRRRELGREEPRLWVRAWPLERVNGAALDGALIVEEANALRAQVTPCLFTGLTEDSFGSSSLPALALANAAYRVSVAVGEAVSLDLRDEVFEVGRDVSDPAVLAEVARRHDVPPVGQDDVDQVLRDRDEGGRRGVVGSPHFFVAGKGYFCPALDIRHEDDEFQVRIDEVALVAFLEAVFGG